MTRRHQLLRLACAALLGSALALPVSSSAAPPSGDPAPTPAARCGPGSRPETGLQGDIPQADVTSGRVKQGYTCNAQLVSHIGVGGGYRVERYIDRAGHVCAFFDSLSIPISSRPTICCHCSSIGLEDFWWRLRTARLITTHLTIVFRCSTIWRRSP